VGERCLIASLSDEYPSLAGIRHHFDRKERARPGSCKANFNCLNCLQRMPSLAARPVRLGHHLLDRENRRWTVTGSCLPA
jgi:hypothetical protein